MYLTKDFYLEYKKLYNSTYFFFFEQAKQFTKEDIQMSDKAQEKILKNH